jgi:biotin carboxyl carrier protein
METEQGRGLLVMTPVYKASIGQESFAIRVLSECELEIDGQICRYDLSQLDDTAYSLILDGSSYSVQLLPESLKGAAKPRLMNGDVGRTLSISVDGSVYSVCVDDHRSMLLKSYFNQSAPLGGVQIIRAPMPGLISRIEVELGEEVSIGKALMVLEAMKMENEIRSLFHGRILKIHTQRGKAVEKGEQLITVEETS